LIPKSSWNDKDPGSQRYYWGWNEVPVQSRDVTNPSNWDSVVIKLPAAICPGSTGGADSIKCLSASASQNLETQLAWYETHGYQIVFKPPPPPPCQGSAGLFLLNRDQSQCLDIKGGNVYNGASMQIWGCNGLPQQNFKWCSDGRIVSALNDKYCLDVPGGDPSKSNYLQMWECNSHDGQWWKYDTQSMAVFPAKTGETMCMGIEHGSTSPGSRVNIYSCKTGTGEAWYTKPVGGVSNATSIIEFLTV